MKKEISKLARRVKKPYGIESIVDPSPRGNMEDISSELPELTRKIRDTFDYTVAVLAGVVYVGAIGYGAYRIVVSTAEAAGNLYTELSHIIDPFINT